MIESLLKRKIEKRPDRVKLQGRILFLTEDPELIKRQLAGEDLPWDTHNPAALGYPFLIDYGDEAIDGVLRFVLTR